MPALPPRRPRPPAGRGRTSRLLPWVALLLPLGYVGTILAVTVHEVLGHGGAALLAGGEFRGFSIQLDGMGYARTRAPDDRILVLASGIAVETILGLALLGAGLLATRKTLPRAALAVLALAFFLDGLPYGFWDAWFQGARGDMGRILALSDWPPLRAVLLAGLGLLYVGTTATTCWLLFCAVESDLGPLSLRAALFVQEAWPWVSSRGLRRATGTA